jgi:hypothetical protein
VPSLILQNVGILQLVYGYNFQNFFMARYFAALIVERHRSQMAKERDSDELDLISTIWILASNDDNALITYRGLIHRLDLPKNYDVKKLVASRPELFRLGATENRVNEWKSLLLGGKGIPSWLKYIESDEERKAVIENLSPNDVFRSQFRTHSNAERSPIEIISWGLQHLDRLRKAKIEAKDSVAKEKQMWLVFWVGISGIVAQIIIAILNSIGWI